MRALVAEIRVVGGGATQEIDPGLTRAIAVVDD